MLNLNHNEKMIRKVKDAVDLTTNKKIYFKGHAKYTYLSAGGNVDDAINAIDDKIKSAIRSAITTTLNTEV